MSGNPIHRLKASAVAALLLSAAALVPASSARQEAAARVEPGRVAVALSALDKEGRPVEGLKPEDLRVTVEGAEQKVLGLSGGADDPLHVVVMLDASASQEVIIPVARQVAAEFVAALLRPGRDDAAVVSFTGDATVVQDLTGDLGALRRAFGSVAFVPPPGYAGGGVVGGGLPSKGVIVFGKRPSINDPALRAASTAIWDSLVYVCDNVFARAKPGRRAVVLVTDGVDTSSRTKSDKAVERLIRDGVVVYCVGIGDAHSFDGVERGGVRKVSERTGGRAFFPKKTQDMPRAFQQVGYALLSPYAVALAPPPSKGAGRLHKLRVEVVNPELRRRGVELAYPQGLFLDAPPPARR